MQGDFVEKVVALDGHNERRFVRRAEAPSPQERFQHLRQLFRRYSARAHAPFRSELKMLFAVGRLPLTLDEWYVVRVENTSYLCCRLTEDGMPLFLISLHDEEDFRLAWEAGCWFSTGMALPAQVKPTPSSLPRTEPVGGIASVR